MDYIYLLLIYLTVTAWSQQSCHHNAKIQGRQGNNSSASAQLLELYARHGK
jgi:hypothetical protein